MQNLKLSIYCYVNDYNLSDLSKLGNNINIIYRNYENIDYLDNLINMFHLSQEFMKSLSCQINVD